MKRADRAMSAADESREALRRVERDTQSIVGAPVPGLGRPPSGAEAIGHRDDGEADPIEVWGQRIGRALSVVLAVVLTWWLGSQLGWF